MRIEVAPVCFHGGPRNEMGTPPCDAAFRRVPARCAPRTAARTGPQLDEGDVSLRPRSCGLEDDPDAHEGYERAAEQIARPDRASRGANASA